MVLQRKQKTSLLELFESHDEGSTLEVAVQPRPPTLLPIHSFPLEQLKKKRKREKKWKEASEEGQISSKDLQPQNGAKIAKGAQKRNTPEGSSIDVVVDCCPRIPIWNPTLELDGAPHLLDSFIRDFQKGWLRG